MSKGKQKSKQSGTDRAEPQWKNRCDHPNSRSNEKVWCFRWAIEYTLKAARWS